ncbi:peptidoglycan-binding protein LysM [Agaricicola taiwanensis]|uniref:Peptidoglycan-binding protein LysM n=1 Tax=Agaricicola taiwanensis TaxID=591372 RepID=A0A8J2VM56_9RHOB|nr:LysM peptidoglycan-binding domain-containing protein [Agaricicola taiwanensis]GGE37689.1 peptidoglycan-binding protein LysM [Agaricicola taiwanensis]
MTPNTIKSLVIGFAFLIAALLGWIGYRAADMDRSEQTAAIPEAPASETPPAAAPATPEPQTTPDPQGQGTEASNAPAEPADERIRAAFDIVRVEPNGDAVIAGRAAPGTTVELLRNGDVIATEKANQAGEFVMTPPRLSAGNHQLQLRVGGEDRQISERSVVVSVPEGGKGEVLVVASEPNKPVEILQQSQGSGVAMAQVAPGSPPVQAQGVGSATAERAEASDAVAAAEPAAAQSLRIGAVEAANGRLFAQGTGPSGSKVRIYLNDAPVAEATVGDDGNWSLTIERGMTPGSYRVRIDQLDGKGEVTARAEVPFDYSETEVAQAQQSVRVSPQPSPPAAAARGEQAVQAAGAPAPAAAQTKAATRPASAADAVVASIDTVAVKRGDSLWRISQNIYGQGIRYSVIYDANSDQIRDPDLIYPNQVFVVPSPN